MKIEKKINPNTGSIQDPDDCDLVNNVEFMLLLICSVPLSPYCKRGIIQITSTELNSYKINVRSQCSQKSLHWKTKSPICETPFPRVVFPVFSPLNPKERGPFSETKSSYSVFHILTTFILRKSLLIVPSMYSNKVKATQNGGVSISYRWHEAIVPLYLDDALLLVESLPNSSNQLPKVRQSL